MFRSAFGRVEGRCGREICNRQSTAASHTSMKGGAGTGERGLEWRTSDTRFSCGLYGAEGPPRWPFASNQDSGRSGSEAEGTRYELMSRILHPSSGVLCTASMRKDEGGSSETGNLPARPIYRVRWGADAGEQNWWPTSFWVYGVREETGRESDASRSTNLAFWARCDSKLKTVFR